MAVVIAGQEALSFDDPRLPKMVNVTDVVKEVIGAKKLLHWAWQQGRANRTINQSTQVRRLRGTAVHGVLKAFHEGRAVHPYDYKADQRPFVDGILDWEQKTKPRILATEVPVEDKEHGVRGRIDVIRKCPGCANCEPTDRFGVVLLDCKTGGLVPSREDHLQVGGGYVHLHRYVAPNVPICGAELLCLDSKGKYEPHPARFSP